MQHNSKRMKSMQVDYSFNESGYASFHGAAQILHNSTLLADATDNSENSQNIQNTTQQQQHANWHHSILTAATAYSKLSEILPTSPIHNGTTSSSSLNYSSSLNIIEKYTPPHEERSATKRQKEHYKPHQHHLHQNASLKKYKKNLFPEEPNAAARTPSYIGVERFDIIGNLPVVPLERILHKLDVQTLASMTQVSCQWQQIVYKFKDAAQRLHCYQIKQYTTKENAAAPVTSQNNLVKSHNIPRNTIVPLHSSNATAGTAIAFTNTWPGFACAQQQKTAILQDFTQNERRVRCPLCGKSSKVISSSNNNIPAAANPMFCLSRTMPALTTQTSRATLNRFSSLDITSTTSVISSQELHTSYAECTGAICKFRFCLDCTCAYHPGRKCPVTELGTPSKILLTPSENASSPKRVHHKTEAKLKRKKSLKRLCF